jgi:molybdate transport system ATP-binding protein
MADTPSSHAALSVNLRLTGPIGLDVAFSVAPGEILALVGPSGSGKTTVLRSIAGLYGPSGGRILCNGSVWLDCDADINVPARARRVGMVFQSYALFPHRSAAENVMEALGDLPAVMRRDQARSLLARLHLDGLEDRRPAELSGGEQQRVAVARALVNDPILLLADEPTGNLDPRASRGIHDLFRDINAAGTAVLIATHDADVLRRGQSSRVLELEHGRLVRDSNPGGH